MTFRPLNMTMENFRYLMEIIGTAVDGVGVCIVAAGAIVATARLLVRRAHNIGNYYSSYRQDIGRAILLGLEFLIAGDIIRTVVVAPTIQNVLVLGLRSEEHTSELQSLTNLVCRLLLEKKKKKLK